MRWKTHRAIGVAGYSALVASGVIASGDIMQLFHAALGGIFTMITSEMPDRIDKVGFKHRGGTHSLLACLIVGAVCLPLAFLNMWDLFYGLPLYLGITTGYTLHVLADFFTDKGVTLLWPLEKRFGISLMSYRTSEGSEGIIRLILWPISIIYWVFLYLGSVFGGLL